RTHQRAAAGLARAAPPAPGAHPRPGVRGARSPSVDGGAAGGAAHRSWRRAAALAAQRRHADAAGGHRTGVGAAARGAQAPLCADTEYKLAGVWDEPHRRAVRAAFGNSSRSYAPATLRMVEQTLDDYTRAWSAMHRDACEATHLRREQSQELLDLRMSCLSD